MSSERIKSTVISTCVWYCSDQFGSQTELNQVRRWIFHPALCSVEIFSRIISFHSVATTEKHTGINMAPFWPAIYMKAADIWLHREGIFHLLANYLLIFLECTQILLSIRCSTKALETFKHWLGWKRPFLLLLPGCTCSRHICNWKWKNKKRRKIRWY